MAARLWQENVRSDFSRSRGTPIEQQHILARQSGATYAVELDENRYYADGIVKLIPLWKKEKVMELHWTRVPSALSSKFVSSATSTSPSSSNSSAATSAASASSSSNYVSKFGHFFSNLAHGKHHDSHTNNNKHREKSRGEKPKEKYKEKSKKSHGESVMNKPTSPRTNHDVKVPEPGVLTRTGSGTAIRQSGGTEGGTPGIAMRGSGTAGIPIRPSVAVVPLTDKPKHIQKYRSNLYRALGVDSNTNQ